MIVSAEGYERSWNIYREASKADDVHFILALIDKIGLEVPAADMNNVNIIGTSNGAGLLYRLIIETEADRPFKRYHNYFSQKESIMHQGFPHGFFSYFSTVS